MKLSLASYLWATSAVLMGLVCLAPNASADGDHRGPPPEAIAACTNLVEGDACKVTFGQNTIDGTCAKTPDGILACRPNHPPPPPPDPK